MAYATYFGSELVLRVWQHTQKIFWENENIIIENTVTAIEFDAEIFVTKVVPFMSILEKPIAPKDINIEELTKQYMPKNEISPSIQHTTGTEEDMRERYPNASIWNDERFARSKKHCVIL